MTVLSAVLLWNGASSISKTVMHGVGTALSRSDMISFSVQCELQMNDVARSFLVTARSSMTKPHSMLSFLIIGTFHALYKPKYRTVRAIRALMSSDSNDCGLRWHIDRKSAIHWPAQCYCSWCSMMAPPIQIHPNTTSIILFNSHCSHIIRAHFLSF